MELKLDNLESINAVAKTFMENVGDNTVLAFYGSMGAGKTTFIKALCKELKVKDQVNSPTFAIVNDYETQTGDHIYHFDFYRINKIEEAFDFGYEDYFYSGSYCFIEWPELVEDILPKSTLNVSIIVNPDGTRTISF